MADSTCSVSGEVWSIVTESTTGGVFATVAVAVLDAVGVLVSEPSLAVTVTVTCSPRFPWFEVERSKVSVVDATLDVVCRVTPSTFHTYV